MADVQRVAVWPASVREIIERKQTPYMLLNENVGVVARAAWWVLHKLGALSPYMESVRRWDYVPHEQKALHEAMLAAMPEDLEYIYNRKAVFIMGGQTFSELVNAPAFRDVMRFDTGPFGMAGGRHDLYGGHRMFDVPIHIVPNMTGMALVPRVIVEKST
jgi:hypothetical protein